MALEDLAMMRAVHRSYPSDATSAAYLVREMADRGGVSTHDPRRLPVLHGPMMPSRRRRRAVGPAPATR
jgi:hypothetical protein